MKKFILLFLLTPLFIQAETELKRVLQIYRSDSEVDSKLDKNQSVYTFRFNLDNSPEQPRYVSYSIDGINGKAPLEDRKITIQSKPGKHVFQFYYSSHYYEVYSDSLEIKPRYHDTYQVQLSRAEEMQLDEKPVIYLYPEKATDVSVQLDIHGEDVFLYPAYDDGWKFTAQPNGDLQFGEDHYNYLFWEAKMRNVLSQQQLSSGFFVEGENAVSFLEEKLSVIGLNSKEQADFITYWGPRLAKNELNFVHFEFNEACETYADIEVSPKPDHINRINMIWGAVSERHLVNTQALKSFNREGFDVLEWGGQESHIDQRIIEQLN